MKVGNVIGGLEVTEVKRVNKLNLIQFLKEVDSYLQQGYNIDVNSARQVGLVLMADVYKTESTFGGVGSVGDKGVGDISKEVEPVSEDTSVPEPQSVQSTNAEDTVEPVVEAPVVEEIAPLTAKKTTTRSKKTAQ